MDMKRTGSFPSVRPKLDEFDLHHRFALTDLRQFEPD